MSHSTCTAYRRSSRPVRDSGAPGRMWPSALPPAAVAQPCQQHSRVQQQNTAAAAAAGWKLLFGRSAASSVWQHWRLFDRGMHWGLRSPSMHPRGHLQLLGKTAPAVASATTCDDGSGLVGHRHLGIDSPRLAAKATCSCLHTRIMQPLPPAVASTQQTCGERPGPWQPPARATRPKHRQGHPAVAFTK